MSGPPHADDTRFDDEPADEFSPELEAEEGWLRSRARRELGPALRKVLDSEDLSQEAKLQALRDLPERTFASRNAFRGWLGAILRNVAAKRARRPTDQALAEFGDVAGRERAPSSNARAKEDGRRAQAMLQRLPEKARIVVALRLFEGLSFAEVAARAGTSEANARMIFSRGIRRLQELEAGSA